MRSHKRDKCGQCHYVAYLPSPFNRKMAEVCHAQQAALRASRTPETSANSRLKEKSPITDDVPLVGLAVVIYIFSPCLSRGFFVLILNQPVRHRPSVMSHLLAVSPFVSHGWASCERQTGGHSRPWVIRSCNLLFLNGISSFWCQKGPSGPRAKSLRPNERGGQRAPWEIKIGSR